MGTKNDPGVFDCYTNADPDEPMFVLLGRDRHAAGLVRLWALLRHRGGEDQEKVQEALACADAMDQWATRRRWALGKATVDADTLAVIDALFEAATTGIAEHPYGFGHSCNCDLCRSYD